MSKRDALISAATKRNWEKLNTTDSNRLKGRANKSRSDKFIIPDNYLCVDGLETLIQEVADCPHSNIDIFYNLCVQKLHHLNSANTSHFFSEYKRDTDIVFNIPQNFLNDPTIDWLGFLYQMRTPEGSRNINGQYYTNKRIVKEMTSHIDIKSGQSFFDPCCGSGAFLMSINATSLSQLFGIDNDEIAIMIAKANLISLYPEDKVYPNLFCCDYLETNLTCPLGDKEFDFIGTNPPWGVSKINKYTSDIIYSGERASLFFVKAFKQLKSKGVLAFLMPSSLLKVKVHKDFRTFAMTETKIEYISLFKERFNGVFTDFFSIVTRKDNVAGFQSYQVIRDDQVIQIHKNICSESPDIELNQADVNEILALIEDKGNDNLSHSIWALGIVTGDNKNKLKKEHRHEYEQIFTGKDICKYTLKGASNYIAYDRKNLQQCAKDEYYRHPEKLVYKFISKELCFAYDSSRSLFLNSANILIPDIEGMSTKTVLAFLNSRLFSYYYTKKFSDVKILKGNLMTLPFPKITSNQDAELSEMVDKVLNGERHNTKIIDEYIYSLYGLTQEISDKIDRDIK